MKRTILLTLACVLAATAAHAKVYGPDGFGYTADTEATFGWVDASDGTDTGIDGDDEITSAMPIGFTFNFYGVDYTEVYATSNGVVDFDNDDERPYHFPQWNENNDFAIMAFAGDRAVYPDSGGHIYYKTVGSAPNRQFIIEYRKQSQCYYGDTLVAAQDDFADTEVILFEGSNEILVMFDNITVTPDYIFTGIIDTSDTSWLIPTDLDHFTVTNGMAIRYVPTENPGASVLPSYAGRTWYDGTFARTYRLYNSTGAPVSYTMTLGGTPVWDTTLSDESKLVMGGNTFDFTVSVDVPGDAPVGASDAASLTIATAPGLKDTSADLPVLTQVTRDFRYIGEQPFATSSYAAGAGLVYEGKAYFFGGYIDDVATSTVYSYNPASGVWNTYDTMPDVADNDNRVTILGQTVYVLGVPNYQSVLTYDIVTKSWDTAAAPPASSEGASLVNDGTTVFIVGGDEDNDNKKLYAYDSDGDSWDTLADLPIGLDFNTAQVIDGKIYVYGGYPDSGDYDGQTSPVLLTYDIASDSWDSETEDLFMARSEANSFQANGRMYIVGGYDLNYTTSQRIPVYDPATGTWSEFAGYWPSETSEFGLAASDEWVITVGGNYTGQSEVYEASIFRLDLCADPDADFSADSTEVETGQDVTFTSNDSMTAPCNYTSVTYDFGDGDTSTDDPATHAYSAAGTYTVTLTASNGFGGDEVVKTDYITVTDPTDDDTGDDDAGDDDAGDDDAGDDDSSSGGDDDDDDDGCCGC